MRTVHFWMEPQKEKFVAIITTKFHFCEIYNLSFSFSCSEIPFPFLPRFNISSVFSVFGWPSVDPLI